MYNTEVLEMNRAEQKYARAQLIPVWLIPVRSQTSA